ncbi:MAG: sulfotransferase [Planctomycetes bacterium]|nr:sulfotransferase [Planctomycetota bacterium]
MNLTKLLRAFWRESPQEIFRKLTRREARFLPSEVECVFVLSTGRVGTETIAALLGLAKELEAVHEPLPQLYSLSTICYKHFEEGGTDPTAGEAFLIAREESIRRAKLANKAYVETSPQVTFLARAISSVYPRSKFIHLLRSPVDVVTSGMRRGWYDGNQWDSRRIVPRTGTMFHSRWDSMSPFEKNIWCWTETNRWISEFRKTIAAERSIMIRSEPLFDGDNNTIDSLFSFVGSAVPSKRKLNKILDKKLNSQTTGEFGSPAEWSSEMKNSFADIAGEVTRDFGYEDVLQSIVPAQ